MENASRALLMAGGMLMAIVVISILVITFRNTSQIEQANQEAQEVEEIRMFNERFASYQKSAMYGTDVISVLNMAISNNRKYDVNPGEDYYVDVIFTLKRDVMDEIYHYKYEEDYNPPRYDKKETISNNPRRSTDALKKDTEYSLTNNYSTLYNFVRNADAPDSKILDEAPYKRIYKDNDKKKMLTEYYEIYYGMANFKRFTFRCIDVDYDDTNGRIIRMEFEHVKED